MQRELLELVSLPSLSFESVTVMLAGEKKTQINKQTNKLTQRVYLSSKCDRNKTKLIPLLISTKYLLMAVFIH